MKTTQVLICLVFLCAVVGTGFIITGEIVAKKMLHQSEPKPPQTVYRIMTEQGLDERQSASTYTPQEQHAVKQLKAVLSRWPKMMWLTSVNGRLVLVKMGMDGKPVGVNSHDSGR